MADDKNEQPPVKRSGLFARIFKFGFVLAAVAGVALVTGFKVQQKTWAWDDLPAFQKYSVDWFQWTKSRAKQIDKQVGISSKAKSGAKVAVNTVQKGVKVIADKVDKQFGEQEAGAPTENQATLEAAQREANLGFTDAEVAQLPAGYVDALREGEGLLRTADEEYARAARERTAWAQTSAKERYEAARTAYEKAEALYPGDMRPKDKLNYISQQIQVLTKDMRLEDY